MSDLVERLRFNATAGIPDFTNSRLLDEAADRIEALEAALKPFAMNADAPSISKALGHISREHLWAAEAALAPEQDK